MSVSKAKSIANQKSELEKEKEFEDYGWEKDKKWHEHLQMVVPVPPPSKLEKMKRRWYKIFVDITFDTEHKDAKDQSKKKPRAMPRRTKRNRLCPRVMTQSL